MPNSIEANRVASPSSLAATWSTEIPSRMSAPEVFFGWIPVRKLDAARAWSPAPSPKARPLLCVSPDRTKMSFRWASKGFKIRVNSKLGPSEAGVHASWITPFGMYTNAKRRGALPTDCRGAPKAGTIASRNGRATTAPAPRKSVRRFRWVLKSTETYPIQATIRLRAVIPTTLAPESETVCNPLPHGSRESRISRASANGFCSDSSCTPALWR